MDGKPQRYGTDGRQQEPTADINQIMMRFRPIAPKPPTVDGGGDGEKKSGGIVLGKKKRRRRRKYVRVSNDSNKQQQGVGKSSCDMEEEDDGRKLVDFLNEGMEIGSVQEGIDLELPLILPPLTVGTEERCPKMWEEGDQLESGVGGVLARGDDREGPSDRTMGDEIRRRVRVVVAVLSVTEDEGRTGKPGNQYGVVGGLSTNHDELGSTDEERWRSLEVDTCPGFISESRSDTVQWSNAAFRRMVGEKTKEVLHDGEADEAEVEVEVKEGITAAVGRWPAGYNYTNYYSCMVQVEYFWQKGGGRRPGWKREVVPCDVWRMNYGGFAWRLDIKAALSLGL